MSPSFCAWACLFVCVCVSARHAGAQSSGARRGPAATNALSRRQRGYSVSAALLRARLRTAPHSSARHSIKGPAAAGDILYSDTEWQKWTRLEAPFADDTYVSANQKTATAGKIQSTILQRHRQLICFLPFHVQYSYIFCRPPRRRSAPQRGNVTTANI